MSTWRSDGHCARRFAGSDKPWLRAGASARVRAAILAASSLLAGTARAGEVPEDAVSRGLSLSPRLLDTASQLYAYPQRAVGTDSSVVTTGAPLAQPALWASGTQSLSSRQNLGGLWRNRHVGLFVLSQPAYLRGPTASTRVYSITPSDQILQAGGAVRWKPIQIGVAFRVTRDREEYGSGTDRSGIVNDYLQGYQHELDYRELCVGVGLETHGVRADAAFEWQDESYEELGIEVSGNEVTALQTTGTARGWSAVSARFAVPAGDAIDVVAAGRVGDADRIWTGTQYLTTTSQNVDFGERTKVWSADLGIVLHHAVPERIIVAASYAYRDEPLAGIDVNSHVPVFTSSKSSTGSLTAAVEQHLWRTLVGRASVSIQYLQTESVWRWLSVDQTRLESGRSETLGDLFAWGLGYTWKSLRAEGAMQVPPQISAPIAVFDLYVTF